MKKSKLIGSLMMAGAMFTCSASTDVPTSIFGKVFDSATSAGDQSQGVCIGADNNVYWHLIGGTTNSIRDIYYDGKVLFQGADYTPSGTSQNNNLCILKTDQTGNTIWKLYSTTCDYAANQGNIAPLSDGGVVFSAKVRNTDDGGSGDFLWNDVTLVDGKGQTHTFPFKHDTSDTRRFYQIVVGRISSDGELLWLKSFQADRFGINDTAKSTFISDAISCPALAADNDDNIYFGGNYRTRISISYSSGSQDLRPHNADNLTSDSQIAAGDMYVIKLRGTDGDYINSGVTTLTSGKVTSETLNALTWHDGTLYAQTLMLGEGAELYYKNQNSSFRLEGQFSPVLMALGSTLEPKWITPIKGETISGKYGFQNCGISVYGDNLWLTGMFDGILSTDDTHTIASTPTTPSVREGFIIKFDATTGEWVKGVSSRDSYPVSLGTGYNALAGYFKAIQNPEHPENVYVFGYQMNNNIGVFLRTYNATSLESDPSTSWTLAKGNMPTCQSIAYNPEDGKIFITARSNRAFTLYGGSTVENPTNTWAILLAGYQMPDTFLQTNIVTTATSQDNLVIKSERNSLVITNSGTSARIEVFDMTGRRVISCVAPEGTISIPLEKGMYIVAGRKVLI